jgi:CheY-like chemotaxis protein
LDIHTREEFLRCLRDGLNHLQDPVFLRRSPLAAFLGVPNHFDTPAELQHILVGAIQALTPRTDEPVDSRAWRIYESLYYRFVEQYDQEEVAHQLGMSVRQLRREQKAALETLSYKLWDQFNIGARPSLPVGQNAVRPGAAPDFNEEEFAWLKNEPSDNPADLNQMLPDVTSLVLPLAARHAVKIESQLDNLPNRAAIDAVAMRQILINLLGLAIQRTAPGGRLQLSAGETGFEIRITLQCSASPHGAAQPPSPDDPSRLELARYLSHLYGGKLALLDTKEAFSITLDLPGLEQLPVLVVEDNEGTLQLFQRYASGTRYRLLGVRSPADALAMVEKIAPQVIVLDVMMPRIDGWEILGRLRSNRATSQVPVIICTIMAQEELALSLGAAGFLKKPVTRQDFLAALDRQAGLGVQAGLPDSASG